MKADVVDNKINTIERQLIIMAKAPVAGYAKTRLIPLLGEQGAAHVQRQLIDCVITTASASSATHIDVCCAPSAQHAYFEALQKNIKQNTQAIRFSFSSQVDGDLGARMEAAFTTVFSAAIGGVERKKHVVMIGTDCPSLQPSTIDAAFMALERAAQAVFAPAEDGGYVLIGLNSPEMSLLRHMPWSEPTLMQTTRTLCAEKNIHFIELKTHFDIDTPSDYERWQKIRNPPVIQTNDFNQ